MPSASEFLGLPPDEQPIPDLKQIEAEQLGAELAPITSGALRGINRVLSLGTVGERDDALLGKKVNRQRGVPFKDYWQYYAISDDKKEKFLTDRFGVGNVARSVSGEPIVRQPNEAGEMEWTRLVAESDSLAYRVSRFPRYLPELAGGIAGFALTPAGKAKAAGFMVKSLASAIGGELAGGAADVVADQAIMGEADVGQIARDRALNVPVNVILDLFTAGAAKGFGKVVSPFTHRGPAQFDMERAIKEVNAELQRRGIPQRWNPTIGERTGNPELMGIEQFSSAMPGSQSVFKGVKEEQDSIIRMLQKIALGQDPRAPIAVVPPLEQTGSDVIKAIKSDAQPFIDAVDTAGKRAAEAVGSEAERLAAARIGFSNPVIDTTVAGSELRRAALAMRQQWKDTSGYPEFFALPESRASTWGMDSLASKFESIKKQAPTFTKATPAGPVETEFKSVGKTRAARLMDEVIGNRTGTISLEKLKQLRTDVDELIDVGQATPDSGTRYLKMIRTAITKEMDDLVGSWGSTARKDQWKLINEAYAQNTEKFQQTGIAELFAEKTQGGRFVPDSDIAERAMRDKETYATYKQFFGAASDPMNVLRRSVANRTIELSTDRIAGDVVDVGSFSRNLWALWKDNPELARETFGERSKDLARLAGKIEQLKGNPNASLSDIRDLMSRGGATVDSINEMLAKQAERDRLFANELVRSSASGNVPTARPQNVVDTLLHSDVLSNEDVNAVMATVSKDPALLEKVRSLAVMDIFFRSSVASKAGDTPAVLRGELPELQVKQLVEELGLGGKTAKGDVDHAKNRVVSVIGSDTYNRLVQMAQLLTPRQAAKEISNIGGVMAAGTERAKINRPGLAKKVEYQLNKAHAWVLAKVYTTPGISAYAANNVMTPERKAALVNAVIASGPFIRETIETWGPEFAQDLIESTKEQTDRIIGHVKEQQDQQFMIQPEDKSVEAFLGLRPPVQP